MTHPKHPSRSLLKAISIILAIVVVGLYTAAIRQLVDCSQGYSIDYGIRDYIYAVEQGRYDDLYDTAIHDMGKDAQYTTEVAECRALAFYYEQALLEHAYRETGEEAKADMHEARMDEYASQLGSLSGKAQAVRDAVSS